MKRILVVCIAVVIALVASGALYLEFMLRPLRQLRARYAQVQRGMTIDQVQALMHHPGSVPAANWYPVRDEQPLPPSEAERIESALHYPLQSSFTSVCFEFSFDREQRLVGKHVYD